jgi:hypothetical protein
MRAWHEASLSSQCHETCLKIGFHGIYTGEESDGGCERRLIVAVRSFGYVELAAHVFLVCRVLRTCSNDLNDQI